MTTPRQQPLPTCASHPDKHHRSTHCRDPSEAYMAANPTVCSHCRGLKESTGRFAQPHLNFNHNPKNCPKRIAWHNNAPGSPSVAAKRLELASAENLVPLKRLEQIETGSDDEDGLVDHLDSQLDDQDD